MLWNGEYPLTPIFTPSTAKGVGQVYDWFPMRSSAQDALGRGVPPYPYFYPLVCEGSGASLGLVPDEVTVPGCFGTNRKVYKCLGHKPLSLHHGRLLDGPLSFRTTGHCKYRFCVAMEIRETDPSPPSRLVGCFPTWPTFVGAAILNS